MTIDRDTASRLGVTPQAIDDTLYDAFGQRQVSTIFTQLNQYRVILEVKPQFQRDARRARQASTCSSPTGGQMPLTAFAQLRAGTAPLAINHQGQFPSVTLSFNLAPGVSLGEAVDAIRARRARDRPARRASHAELLGHARRRSGRRSRASRS